jgi:hypothetical protein
MHTALSERPRRRQLCRSARQWPRRSVAVIVAVGVNNDGRREVLGRDIGPKAAAPPERSASNALDARRAAEGMAFAKEHRQKIYSTNPLERLNGEIKRRTEVVGIFPPPAVPPQSRFAKRNPWPAPPNEDTIIRLVGAILLEQNAEWAVQRARHMTLETIAPLSDDPIARLPAVAA